jgi:NADPH:quinone reductase-like Zn-dependent oxidoreductase
MKAYVLTKYGKPEQAFQLKDVPVPELKDNEILIKVEAFGLNYADVMARNGLYQDAPPLPCIIGYDVAGKIEKIGKNVTNLHTGQRVVALTRFGGYAEYVATDYRAVAAIPDEMNNGTATAIATQYCTAYFSACEMVNLFPNDHVLIHAAAGGVGTALVQIAKKKGCIVYGTAGSDKKIDYLKSLGVDYPINYNKSDFEAEIKKIRGKERIDVIFDSIGGKVFSKSKKLLAHGGRMVCYGVAERSGKSNSLITGLGLAVNFGLLHPIWFLLNSKGIIGVNMLRIADHKPFVLQRCLQNVTEMIVKGELSPQIGGTFKSEEIAKAHAFLESRQSTGKIVVEW